jgi:hypothetical protein
MNTRDLFELASLDVLGLLDDDERRAFEAAFRAAPASTQAQIRREQLRAAHTLQAEWLPSAEVPFGMKGKVMASVREAINAARAGELGEHVARRIGPLSVRLQRNVSPLWRAAAIGLLTASAVLTVALVRQSDQYDGIRRTVMSDAAVAAMAEQFGAEFASVLTSPTSDVRTLRPVGEQFAAASGRIVIDEANGNVYLLCNTLPPRDDGYRVVLVNDRGEVERELSRFESTGGFAFAKFAAKGVGVASTLAILPGSGPVTMDRAVLVTA